MNFIKFSTGTTNVFPMANSVAGGQLLTEYNLRSRESVATDSTVRYMIGPSYTHSRYDFEISLQKDSTGTTVSNNTIQISEGRALVNGHFVESLAPVTIDLTVANAEINKYSGNEGSKPSELKGDLAIGLRTMYSMEPTTSGALLTEDDNNMFKGVQIVILPKAEFKLPSDVPENPNQVTAHLKLGEFNYRNGNITGVKQNPDKVAAIGPDRISNVQGYLSGAYISKSGLDPHHHYVFSAKGDSGTDGLCKADESLMVWDSNPAEPSPTASHSTEAMFVYNPSTSRTELVLPHKQIDGAENSRGEAVYFEDKVLPLPTANYSAGTGGVVDSIYTSNIHNIAETVERLFTLPNGGMKAYIPILEDKETQLPRLSVQTSWQVGDYVLVGQDMVIEGEDEDDNSLGYPSTMYVIIPGKVKTVEYAGTRDYNLYDVSIDLSWEDMMNQIMQSVDWRDIITKNYAGSPSEEEDRKEYWEKVIRNAVYDVLTPILEFDWQGWIGTYIPEDVSTYVQGWKDVIMQAWSEAKPNYDAGKERRFKIAYGLDEDQPIPEAYQAAYQLFDGLTTEMFQCVTAVDGQDSQGQERTSFPVPNLINSMVALAEEEASGSAIDWGKYVQLLIANGVASVSGVGWGDLIVETAKSSTDLTNIAWDKIVSSGVMSALGNTANKIITDNQESSLPDMLYGTECIEIGRVTADADFNCTDPTQYNEVLGISAEDMSREGYPRGRKDVDFFRVIVENETDNKLYHHFYRVSSTTDIEYSDPPVKLTGRIPLAYEDSIGGFYNVPETSLGNGYVYRNADGYLQLLDYDLLVTGVLAYQLGEDFTCPAGLDPSEIQTALDEYVNNRVAFPNANQVTAAQTQLNAGNVGPMTDPSVINVYIDLSGSEEDEGYELNVQNIDSRFGGSVYLHVTGDGSGCVLNIVDCEKIRLDINTTTDPIITLTDSCVYYDADVLDELDLVSGLSLWYKRYSTSDPDITVDGMYVEYAGAPDPEEIKNEDFWQESSPNDNHFTYALKGLKFDTAGNIASATMLVTCDTAWTDIHEGPYCSAFKFSFPQTLGLQYPATKLNKTIKITGDFVTAYPSSGDAERDPGYYIAETNFSALTYPNTITTSDMTGIISFKTDVQFVENIYGLPQEGEDDSLIPMYIDSWAPGSFHIFSGGTVDVHS